MKAEVVFTRGRITAEPYPVLKVYTGRKAAGHDFIVLSLTCASYQEDRVASCIDLEAIAEVLNR